MAASGSGAAAGAEGRGGADGGGRPPPQGLAERRLLRSRYLAMKNLISDEKDDMAKEGSDKFASIITQVESLHELANTGSGTSATATGSSTGFLWQRSHGGGITRATTTGSFVDLVRQSTGGSATGATATSSGMVFCRSGAPTVSSKCYDHQLRRELCAAEEPRWHHTHKCCGLWRHALSWASCGSGAPILLDVANTKAGFARG